MTLPRRTRPAQRQGSAASSCEAARARQRGAVGRAKHVGCNPRSGAARLRNTYASTVCRIRMVMAKAAVMATR
jgi:hypothetical protein